MTTTLSTKLIFRGFILRLILIFLPFAGAAQEKKFKLEHYGFIMVDAGYNFNSIDPDWFDVMRPTQLPKYKGQHGPPGNTFFSVRQTRFGLRTSMPTLLGEFKTDFLFDLVGFGKDSGQTTFHLINAFAQLGKFGFGQTASPFMDLDVYPITLDYWGPCSRIFNMNVQLRYQFIERQTEKLVVALERPGATADGGDYAGSIELQNVRPVFQFPVLSGHYRKGGDWGYIQIAAIFKSLKWKDKSDTAIYHLAGSDFGWGGSINANLNPFDRLKIKIQTVFGEGVQNYIADVSPDVGLKSNPGNPSRPFEGAALPVIGLLSFAEIKWTDKIHSSVGYSFQSITNTDLQLPNAFKKGQYALINLRYYPTEKVMMGLEYLYGRRDNFEDGFHSIGNMIRLGFKYNFSSTLFSN